MVPALRHLCHALNVAPAAFRLVDNQALNLITTTEALPHRGCLSVRAITNTVANGIKMLKTDSRGWNGQFNEFQRDAPDRSALRLSSRADIARVRDGAFFRSGNIGADRITLFHAATMLGFIEHEGRIETFDPSARLAILLIVWADQNDAVRGATHVFEV